MGDEAWIEGDETARWRSRSGPNDDAVASGTSLLEVEPGRRLPEHTDSAEETIVVVSGRAAVRVGERELGLAEGDVAVIPADVLHEVRSVGDETLRFVAVYAAADVTTTYQLPVEPDGSRERKPVG